MARVKQIEAGGKTFGVTTTWGNKLDYQDKIAAFWTTIKEENPPVSVFESGMLNLQHEYLCSVLAEVDEKPVTDANALLRGMEEEEVADLLVGIGIAQKLPSAEGNSEGGSTQPPEAGSEESQ